MGIVLPQRGEKGAQCTAYKDAIFLRFLLIYLTERETATAGTQTEGVGDGETGVR